MTIRVLSICSVAACLPLALYSLAAPGGEEHLPSKSRTIEQSRSAEGRVWSSSHRAAEGPILNEAWFRDRKAVVYLMPPGGGRPMRSVANSVMRELWSEGDWETNHIFVGGAVSAPIFALSRRIGTQDATREVERVAIRRGESPEKIAKVVRQHVFCVHDREASLWPELLGPDDSGSASAEADAELPIAVLVLDGGHVVGSVEIEREADVSEEDESGRLVTEVRQLLESRESVASR